MGTRWRTWVSAMANPQETMQELHATSEEADGHCACLSLQGWAFSHKGLFSWAQELTRVSKAKFVPLIHLSLGEEWCPIHHQLLGLQWSLHCDSLGIVKSLCFTNNSRESRGAPEVGGGSAGSRLLWMPCKHFSSVLISSLLSKADSSVGKVAPEGHIYGVSWPLMTEEQ